MELKDVILSRRSIRKYDSSVEVKDEDIKTILTAAMHAPSARNTRPWDFIVVKNKEVKEKLVSAHPYARMILESDVVICVVARPDLQSITSEFWPQDCGAATQNILLQAFDLGYGTCWCGVYPNEERVKLVSEALDIKQGIPFNLIALGKASENPSSRGYYDDSKVRVIE